MDFGKHIFKDRLHHAYLIVGEDITFELKDFLEQEVGVTISGNPDFWHGQFDTFTIDDARKLSDSQERKTFGESRKGSTPKKIFIIETNTVSEQAQNALLKVFQEPTAGTHFFLVLPQNTLLPTLRSRVQIIQSESHGSVKSKVLEMKPAERLALIKEIIDNISDEEKTKQDAIVLVNEIETGLYKKGMENVTRELTACEHARESLYDNGAPIKMILENLMLII